ncbi:protein disulfide isomerase family A, member 8 isoform X2 [Dunckerocampus dactyliophorus]|uniref:protein disulfide isomerase family A, member 8 isoform X2 n=1 Tax=Dunckerocampus dactyliophorus TaxID=161453 RepID=UPI002405CC88|nr:protein disulfide isomerase family A, member 8 isoform X2 [Dunckerocampus dactyliophorus]
MAAAGRLLPAVTLVWAFAFPSMVSSRRDVLKLGDADFDYLAIEHDTMLVKFYAPWCGHCKKLAPEFEKAATKLKGTVQLAKVDCTAHVGTCTRFGVTGYPTLKIFRNGRDWASYDGPRSAEGIYQYMNKQTGPDSVSLLTEEDLQIFIDHCDASIIGVFSGEEGSRLSEYLKAAGLLRDQFRFAHTTQKNLSSPYGLHSEGVLLFRPPRMSNQFEDSVVIFKDFLTISSLRRFIRDHIFGLCPHMTLENKDRLRVRDLLTVFYRLDYKHNPKGSNYWRNRVMKVATKYVGRGLTFSVANKKDFQSELEDDFGLGTSDSGDLPLVTIRTKLGHKYTMREEFTRDGQSLDRFLNDYFMDRLKRYIKSESVPEKHSGAVQVVVAELFDPIVNDPTKDVLIQFYSPSCPHCKKLQPVYTQLAKMLSADPTIVIAKMNAVDNDVPPGYDVQGKDQPIRYEGGRELRDFLRFLRREANHSPYKQEL